jgi:hypothetical protein
MQLFLFCEHSILHAAHQNFKIIVIKKFPRQIMTSGKWIRNNSKAEGDQKWRCGEINLNMIFLNLNFWSDFQGGNSSNNLQFFGLIFLIFTCIDMVSGHRDFALITTTNIFCKNRY